MKYYAEAREQFEKEWRSDIHHQLTEQKQELETLLDRLQNGYVPVFDTTCIRWAAASYLAVCSMDMRNMKERRQMNIRML